MTYDLALIPLSRLALQGLGIRPLPFVGPQLPHSQQPTCFTPMPAGDIGTSAALEAPAYSTLD